MAPPVQSIKVEKKAKTDFRGAYQVYVDRQPLDEWLNDLALELTRMPWPDQPRCFIDEQVLKRSGSESGPMEIVICANCAASGYKSCGDIGLVPFEIDHEGGRVGWTVAFADGSGRRKLVFDRAQYLRELEKIS